jgi:hypothetical protein
VPPPPQVWGAVHDPQATVPPQPFGAVPQFCPDEHACRSVSGVQPHTFAVLGIPPPQVSGGEQEPQV